MLQPFAIQIQEGKLCILTCPPNSKADLDGYHKQLFDRWSQLHMLLRRRASIADKQKAVEKQSLKKQYDAWSGLMFSAADQLLFVLIWRPASECLRQRKAADTSQFWWWRWNHCCRRALRDWPDSSSRQTQEVHEGGHDVHTWWLTLFDDQCCDQFASWCSALT